METFPRRKPIARFRRGLTYSIVLAAGICVCWRLSSCEGPFIEASRVQAVSPDGSVKAFLAQPDNEAKSSRNELDELRFEARAWQAKPSVPIARTRGSFLALHWRDPRDLVVFGRKLEDSLVRNGCKVSFWRYGRFWITFERLDEMAR